MSAWRGTQGVAALGVIAVMVATRWVLLAGSYFNQDDFYLSGRAYASDLTVDFLVRDTAGHVNPLQQLSYWLVAHHAPYDWAVVAAGILLMQTAATVLMWLILTRLLGERWSRLPLLALFAWAPLTLATTLWWSAAMGLWPHVLCSLAAVWLLVRWQQAGGRRWVEPVAIVAITVVGLLWHERAVLIPPLVFGVAVALADDAIGWRRLTAALVRFRWLWAALVALLAGFLVAHGLLTDVEGGGGSASRMLAISWSFLGENVVPGVAGGPWTGHLEGGAVVPATWVTVVSIVLAVAAAGWLLLRGGPARRWGLAVLAGYVAADLALVLSGRAGFGSVIGLDPRYSSDVVHAAVVCLALAWRGAPAPPRVPPRLAAGALVAAYGVAAAFGTALLVPHFQNTEDRELVTTLRSELAADPTQVLVDDLAPADVVLPLVGDDSLYSRILAPLPEMPEFDDPSPRLRLVADDGRLVAPELDDSITARAGRDDGCGYAVDDRPVDVRFRVPLAGRVLVQLGYFTDREATVTIGAGDWSAAFLARPGPNQVWFVLPDLGREVDRLELESDGRATVCVTDAEAGLPEEP
ncbi:hypothetical protein HNR19_001734 [Nocardioides thalensis]|uniref:Uncharacterized protein n=1 Tax=Nocardioides thalensis TaxID=1914755 RepID=A0A853C210_9ACTN|nr:hypothetical protein [Nocardioides thalensis]NYJ01036.1 hypothetical protein [Nocardioides thalensis]